jgi:hypothetical protein
MGGDAVRTLNHLLHFPLLIGSTEAIIWLRQMFTIPRTEDPLCVLRCIRKSKARLMRDELSGSPGSRCELHNVLQWTIG